MSLRDVIEDATKDRIRDKGYRPAELAQRLPSTRRQYMSRIMQGRETVSIERATSIMEAAGLEIDVKSIHFKVKDSQAPSGADGDGPRGLGLTLLVTYHSRGIYRTREQTRALKDAILGAWACGQDSYAIAEACGVPRDYVHFIVVRARRKGNPRAERRRAPNKLRRWRHPEGGRASHARGRDNRPGIASVIGQKQPRARESLHRAGLL